MNDTTEAECWYDVEYSAGSEKPRWDGAFIGNTRFTTDLAAARERLTTDRFLDTKERRLLRHTLVDGVIHTEVIAHWTNPRFQPIRRT